MRGRWLGRRAGNCGGMVEPRRMSGNVVGGDMHLRRSSDLCGRPTKTGRLVERLLRALKGGLGSKIRDEQGQHFDHLFRRFSSDKLGNEVNIGGTICVNSDSKAIELVTSPALVN